MALKFKDNAKETLREEIDIELVIDELGIERDNKRHIICPNPNHHDNNFGSCIISKNRNRVHCYACGETFDNIKLYQLSGKTFLEALKELADLSGHPSDFYYDDLKIKPYRQKKLILTKGEKRLIGLVDKAFSYPCGISDEKPKKGRYTREYDKNGFLVYVMYKTGSIPFISLPYEEQVDIVKNRGVDTYIKKRKMAEKMDKLLHCPIEESELLSGLKRVFKEDKKVYELINEVKDIYIKTYTAIDKFEQQFFGSRDAFMEKVNSVKNN